MKKSVFTILNYLLPAGTSSRGTVRPTSARTERRRCSARSGQRRAVVARGAANPCRRAPFRHAVSVRRAAEREHVPLVSWEHLGWDSSADAAVGLSGTGKLRGFTATPHRRGRAWLERHGRLQSRGRLLRQVYPPVAREQAADLDRHTLRHGSGKCRRALGHPPVGPSTPSRSRKTHAPPT